MKGMEKKIVARNKKASHDYFILDTLECGIVLTGTEIKSIRLGKVSIQDAYCQVKNDTLNIYNMHIAKYEQGNIFNHKETRDRVLLAHKKEIRKLSQKTVLEGLTIVPLSVYLFKGMAKLEVALCRGKKNYDKRDDLRKEAVRKDVNKAMKYNY